MDLTRSPQAVAPAERSRSNTVSAVILARGLGKRMRKADVSAVVGGDQAAAADAGVKAMIPIGRPFLDYVLSALADAGFERVCLVIGPEHKSIRDHYDRVRPSRLSIEYAVQQEPLGTANAVLAAEPFANGDPFVVLNSDNYYPVEALALLRRTEAPAIVGFARSALIESGNVDPGKAERFGALEISDDGFLQSIIPRRGVHSGHSPGDAWASMNCWLFDSRIFDACRAVPLSARGEFELPKAVELAIDTMGMQFRVIRMTEPVLDLSTRADIAEVQARLAGVVVTL